MWDGGNNGKGGGALVRKDEDGAGVPDKEM